jgi:hypothetical protein
MSLYHIYYRKSDFNIFQNISSYYQGSINIPEGYSFNDHIWTYLYNSSTNNKIGILFADSKYVKISNTSTGGYCSDNITLFIENELPNGTINYLYDFYTNTNTTTIDTGIHNPTFQAGTEYYYNKDVLLKLSISDTETRDIFIYC